MLISYISVIWNLIDRIESLVSLLHDLSNILSVKNLIDRIESHKLVGMDSYGRGTRNLIDRIERRYNV